MSTTHSTIRARAGGRAPGRLGALALGLLALPLLHRSASAQDVGELAVKSKPPGATISIDGQPAGKAPLTKAGLTVGKHDVDAVWPDGMKAHGRGKVQAGKSVTVWMKPPAGKAPDESSAAATGTDPSMGSATSVPGATIADPYAAAPADPNAATAAAPAPEAPPAAPASTLTIVPRPVVLPFHPRLSGVPAMTLGLGVYCPNLSNGSRSAPWGSWCTGQLYLGADGPMGNVHVAFLAGASLRVGAKIGFDLGTRFFQLGRRSSKAAMAVRGSFDLLLAQPSGPIPGQADDGLLGFSNTYGPQFSVALSPRTSLEIHTGVGWTVTGFFDRHDGFDRPIYGFVCEGWIGMRFGK